MTGLQRPGSVAEMRQYVSDGYGALLQVLDRVSGEQWNSPGADGWSPKEQLGHVAFWESTLLWRAGLWSSERAGDAPADLPFGDTDGVNARLRDWIASQSVDEVRERSARLHAAVTDLLGGFGDDQLDEPFRGDSDDPRPRWQVVAAETWTHYPEHVAMLERSLGT